MKTKNQNLIVMLALLALSTLSPQLSTVQAQTTAFTFQGQLASGAGNANGLYDLRFAVFDANVSGNQIAGPVTNSTVAVANGLFTVTLDFGAGVFTGTNYFVEMGVRTNGGGAFATLAPRQQLTPAPAAFSLSVKSPQYNSLCPPGAVMAFAGATAPPGWFLCNNTTAPSRTIFSNLFAVIGTTYGTGDGSTTFNLPDMRGRTGIGAGQGAGLSNRTLGQTLGEETHLLTTAEIPAHSHPVNAGGLAATTAGTGGNSWLSSGDTGNAHPVNMPFSIGNNIGGGGAHNVMQPSLVLNYIIKY